MHASLWSNIAYKKVDSNLGCMLHDNDGAKIHVGHQQLKERRCFI